MEQSNLESLEPRPTKAEITPVASVGPLDRLTHKQKIFVERFLRHGNAVKAAREAGYSDSVAQQASITIRHHPQVAAEINRRLTEFYHREEVTTDTVLRTAWGLANSNLLDYFEVQEDGSLKPNFKDMTREQAAAIQEFSYDPEGRPKLRLVDKKASLELYARLKKMFSDSEDSGQGGKGFTIQMLDSIVQKVENQNIQVNVISQGRQELPEKTGSQ